MEPMTSGRDGVAAAIAIWLESEGYSLARAEDDLAVTITARHPLHGALQAVVPHPPAEAEAATADAIRLAVGYLLATGLAGATADSARIAVALPRGADAHEAVRPIRGALRTLGIALIWVGADGAVAIEDGEGELARDGTRPEDLNASNDD